MVRHFSRLIFGQRLYKYLIARVIRYALLSRIFHVISLYIIME